MRLFLLFNTIPISLSLISSIPISLFFIQFDSNLFIYLFIQFNSNSFISLISSIPTRLFLYSAQF